MTDHLPTPLLFVFPADFGVDELRGHVVDHRKLAPKSLVRHRQSFLAGYLYRTVICQIDVVPQGNLDRLACLFQGQFWSWDVCAIL